MPARTDKSDYILLRSKIDCICKLADADKTCVTTDRGHEGIRVAISEELGSLCLLLDHIDEEIRSDLPDKSSDEPVWGELIQRMKAMACDYENQDSELTEGVYHQIQEAIAALESIKNWMLHESILDNVLMASYAKTMLQSYIDSNQWDIDLQKSKSGCTETSLKWFANQINEMAKSVLDEKKSTIRLKDLGIFLWENRFSRQDENPSKSILFLIKSYEQRLKKEGVNMDYMDEPFTLKRSTESSILKEAEKRIRKIKHHLIEKCREFYTDESSVEFVTNMIDDMLKMDGNQIVINKLSGDSYFKFAHQIAGMLMEAEIIVGCTQGQLVRTMEFCNEQTQKPSTDSRERFLRDKMDDAPNIRDWITEKIREFKKNKITEKR